MDPERWARLKVAFHEAAELPPTARGRLLENYRAEDPDLHAELTRLLAAHDAADDFLEGRGEAAVQALRTELQAAVEGLRIGPYRVISELGRGGMGAVYLAERTDGGFEQQVAVKLLKRGMDTEEIVRRFVAERQILAGLAHPNIARLLDGGQTADGRPYFVLEAVSGEPVTRWADARGLSVEERLRLFLPIAAAVQFAHRNLVVHRDLKPANVLVDDQGVPKLLDFGIAKLLDPAAGVTGLTMMGAAPLTPDYASPEQFSGAPVTTATDVYGLGVLLHELVVGTTPATAERELGTGWRRRSASTIARARAERGALDPRRARSLAGDLDTILGKALDPEPAARYGTVAELAEDVERHLERRPVRARRPTLLYRTSRLVRRNKLAAGLVLAVVVAAVAATLAAVGFARQRDRAAAESRRAEAQSRRLQAVKDFQVGLFKVADPGKNRGESVTARALLEAASRSLLEPAGSGNTAPRWLPESLGRQTVDPEVRADLLQAIGETFLNLGVPAEAERAFRAALLLREGFPGEDAQLDVATTVVPLGHLAQERGDFAAAETLFRRALGLRRKVLGGLSDSLGEPLGGLGMVARQRGDTARAEAFLRRALAVERGGDDAGAERRAAILINLSNGLAEDGRLDEAAEGLAEAAAIHRRLYGEDHPRAAEDWAALGGLEYNRGDFEQAAEYLGRAIELRRRILGPDHPNLAIALSNLAAVEYKRERPDAAARAAQEALSILARMTEPPSPDLVDAMVNLAEVSRANTTPARSEEVLRSTLAAAQAVYGLEHGTTATVLGNLAIVLRDQGELAEAERLLRQSLDVRRRVYGTESAEAARSLHALGTVLERAKRPAEAEAAFRQGLAARRAALPAGHPDVSTSLIGLGELLVVRGRAGEALPLLEEALAIRRAAYPAGHPRLGYAERALGSALAALGRKPEAVAKWREALAVLTEALGADHSDVVDLRGRLERLGGAPLEP